MPIVARMLLIPLVVVAGASDTRPGHPRSRRPGGAECGIHASAVQRAAVLRGGESWWGSKAKGFSLPTGGNAEHPEVKKAEALMNKRGLRDVETAVKLLRDVHKRDPDDASVQLELADALNTVMRIKTNANALVIDGTLDTPSNKKVWKSVGDEALPLAKSAYSNLPGEVRALAVYADAFMFSASSKGIVKQALSGTAKEYKRIANELRKHPEWDGAVGLVFLGGLYNVAPWPVGNKQEARKLLSEAAEIAPTRRNLYYVGVNAYQLGEMERASSYFERALGAACGSDTEADFGDFLLDESRKGLGRAKAAMQDGGS